MVKLIKKLWSKNVSKIIGVGVNSPPSPAQTDNYINLPYYPLRSARTIDISMARTHM